jgi:hypothetical protein
VRSKLSKDASAMRMKVLTDADKVVNELKAEAKLEVAKIAKTPDYKKLLEDLIVEVRCGGVRRAQLRVLSALQASLGAL